MVAPQWILLVALGAGLLFLQLPRLPSQAHFYIGALCILLCLLLSVLFSWWRASLKSTPFAAENGLFLATMAMPMAMSMAMATTIVISGLWTLENAVYWQSHQLPAECERQKITVDGVIKGLTTAVPGYGNTLRFEVQVSAIRPETCSGPKLIRVYADFERAAESLHDWQSAQLPVEFRSGSRLSFDARLRRPWGSVNPYAAHGERSFAVTGLHAVGSLSTLHELSNSQRDSSWPLIDLSSARESASNTIQMRVPGEVGALLAALAVGDRRGITAPMWTRLRVYGLTHLMVISGMHVTLIALPGWILGATLSRGLGLRHGSSRGGTLLAPLAALTFASIYAALAGFGLPAQRAVLLLTVVLVPQMLGRRVHRARALSVAVLGLFFLNPLGLLTASFWLSVGAVGLLLWFGTWTRAQGWLRELWDAQGYMLLAMLPMGLFWFQEASGIGGVVNLLAIPLVTVAIVPLLLGSLVLAPIAGSIATVLLKLSAVLLSLLWSAMAYWQPLVSEWSLVRASPGPAIAGFALMGVLLVAMPRFRGRAVAIALFLVPLLWSAPGERDGTVKLVFFDVGQGTSVLITQGKTAVVYDTGGGAPEGPPTAARTVLPMLYATGTTTLDTLVISHPDRDHSAGEALIREVAPPITLRRGVSDSAVERCRLGESRRLGRDIVLRYLSQRIEGDSDNNASCVLLLSVYGHNILLPGDIDASRERELLAYWGQILKADVLLAGHHGSASSSSRLWLRSVDPRLFIVTAARANRFGHPAKRVGDGARDQGAVMLNTAFHGAVTVTISPRGDISCEVSRHRWSPFWRGGDANRYCLPPQRGIHRYNQRDF